MIVLYKEYHKIASLSEEDDIEVYMNTKEYCEFNDPTRKEIIFLLKNFGENTPFIKLVGIDIFIPYNVEKIDDSCMSFELEQKKKEQMANIEHHLNSMIRSAWDMNKCDLTGLEYGIGIAFDDDFDYSKDEYVNEIDYMEKQKKDVEENYNETISEIFPVSKREKECNEIIKTVEDAENQRKKNDTFKDKKSSFFGGLWH